MSKLNVREEFEKFKKEYSRSYDSKSEEERRFEIFAKNLADIEAHNEQFEKGEVTWSKGVNQFADMTSEEFQRQFCGVRCDK